MYEKLEKFSLPGRTGDGNLPGPGSDDYWPQRGYTVKSCPLAAEGVARLRKLGLFIIGDDPHLKINFTEHLCFYN